MKKLYFILFTVLCFASYGQEMLTNGDLETWGSTTDPSDWDKHESVTQETTIVHGGTYSAKVVAGSTRDLQQNISGITPGESYTLSLWYYIESGDGSDARIWSYWLNGTSTVSDAPTDDDLRGPGGTSSFFTGADGSWHNYSVTVTAPASGVDGFRFEVRAYSGSTVYWDDLSFVNNNTLSVENNAQNTFKLYPNPTNTGVVNITSTSNQAIEVAVFDLLGKQVKQQTLTDNTLNVSDLNSGVYIVRLTQNGASTTKKLVIN